MATKELGRGMTGEDLKARRLAKGWSQPVGATGRNLHRAVHYWERQESLDPFAYAVANMADALGWRICSNRTRARGGVLSDEEETELLVDVLLGMPKPLARRLMNYRVTCGARTRKGTPCRAKSESNRRRCRFHGGLSTGPKTAEGRERIAEAQRKRWAERSKRGASQADPDPSAVQ